jgi:ABC-type methionine transport system ATPase subunit
VDGAGCAGHARGVASVRVRLTFPEHLITEPVIARMMRRFDVLPNIRRANIEATVGWMVCEITGEAPVLEQALGFLSETGVQVDRLGDVVEG